jgi:hypothetical protein
MSENQNQAAVITDSPQRERETSDIDHSDFSIVNEDGSTLETPYHGGSRSRSTSTASDKAYHARWWMDTPAASPHMGPAHSGTAPSCMDLGAGRIPTEDLNRHVEIIIPATYASSDATTRDDQGFSRGEDEAFASVIYAALSEGDDSEYSYHSHSDEN